MGIQRRELLRSASAGGGNPYVRAHSGMIELRIVVPYLINSGGPGAVENL